MARKSPVVDASPITELFSNVTLIKGYEAVIVIR
jgi:hypothetical protein